MKRVVRLPALTRLKFCMQQTHTECCKKMGLRHIRERKEVAHSTVTVSPAQPTQHAKVFLVTTGMRSTRHEDISRNVFHPGARSRPAQFKPLKAQFMADAVHSCGSQVAKSGRPKSAPAA